MHNKHFERQKDIWMIVFNSYYLVAKQARKYPITVIVTEKKSSKHNKITHNDIR